MYMSLSEERLVIMSELLFIWTVGRREKEEGFQGEIMRVGNWRGLKVGPEERE